jgi:predicted hydrocarbon binding protein
MLEENLGGHMTQGIKPYHFQWKDLGDIELGRPNLGNTMSVAVYRLMQYTMRDVLNRRFSSEIATDLLREAGNEAGREFCINMLNTALPLNGFVAQLQDLLQSLKIGIMRLEKSDAEHLDFTLTVSEDLDCSGLPVSGVTVCEYDEGFIAGIFEAYTGKTFTVREVDCWATGDRTCRFRAVAAQEIPS